MEKKTETIAVHVDDVTKLRFAQYAAEFGTDSSKLGGKVIADFLSSEDDRFRLLQKIFDSERTSSN